MRHLMLERWRRDERGSIIIAVEVIMVITLISIAVVARTLSALASVHLDEDFSASLAQADAGLSDALFRIDQFGANDIASFCVGPHPSCYPSAVPVAPAASYKAVRVDSNSFTVTAIGVVNNRPHAIRATVVRTALYPFAIFGNGDVTFNGNGSGTIRATLPDGSTDPNRFADAGSNNTVTCHSGANEGDEQVSYKNSWNGCPTQVAGVGTYVPKDPVVSASCPVFNTNLPPVPCMPASFKPCPSGNVFSGSISGTYYCTGSVTFSSAGPITVSAPFRLYLIPTSGNANVDFTSTTINDKGDPRDFSVYLAGAGTVDMGNGAHNATITGTVWAPSANITSNGCKMDLTGALVIGTYTCNGGPNLTVNYDSRLQTLTSQNWAVKNYTEIPSNQFFLPGF
ncbi:MAG: hypothetical protein QOE07_2574 [Acidimicrobiaceae bacterium]|nr:hypothetical protein [Acidimicrobiaceae bacterium]